MQRIIFTLSVGLCLTVPAHAFTIQDAVDIRHASEACGFPLTTKAKELLKKFYRTNAGEFERLYAQYDNANISVDYCPRVYKGFGESIFAKPRLKSIALPSPPIPATEGAAPAGSLQGYADRCELQLTGRAKRFIAMASKAARDSFNSAKSAAQQDPTPCEGVIGYYLKGGEMYDNFGFDVIVQPAEE